MAEGRSRKTFEVLHSGAMASIQDLGRIGYQKYGVPISGAMDKFSLRVANLLAGNSEGDAALEITVVGPRLRALRAMKVGLAGGDLSPRINGQPCSMWRSYGLKEGDLLSFGPVRSGCRAYVAISGGIFVPKVMGSCSTHVRLGLGGLGRAIEAGDIIHAGIGRSGENLCPHRVLPERLIPIYTRDWLIRFIPGPQSAYFTSRGLRTFMTGEYVVTPQSDRMASRLKGPKIEHRRGADVISDATPPGSIQIPGDGMPILFHADGQATGGYAKIGVAVTPDQDRLAQSKPGDTIRFQRADLEEARRLWGEAQDRMREARASLQKI
ncbi:MAG TPA: biotin-dependent carboxyltransferase family protein [Thermodesulfobacteriota bacterium]|nr:biotin-dependent carboxyltransferase family protein [Thermodesulfobacteriota bacterium]